jgi:hypothetical protein
MKKSKKIVLTFYGRSIVWSEYRRKNDIPPDPYYVGIAPALFLRNMVPHVGIARS